MPQQDAAAAAHARAAKQVACITAAAGIQKTQCYHTMYNTMLRHNVATQCFSFLSGPDQEAAAAGAAAAAIVRTVGFDTGHGYMS